MIIVGGVAEAGAGALAMGTGSYLASRAENQLFRAEIDAEEAELALDPEGEIAELELLLIDEGLAPDAAAAAGGRSGSERALVYANAAGRWPPAAAAISHESRTS